MSGRGANWRGRLGLLVAFLLWVASVAALIAAVKANATAGLLARQHGKANVDVRVEHLRGLAVMWSLVLTGLQISSLLAGAGVLRVFYRLRSAVCFAVSGGAMILLNALWLFGLLVWLRVYGDTR